MHSLNDILTAAEALPSSERAELLVALWDRLTTDDWIPPSTDWVHESQRRSDALDAGEMDSASWSEVRGRDARPG
jgi:hypothetical protein